MIISVGGEERYDDHDILCVHMSGILLILHLIMYDAKIKNDAFDDEMFQLMMEILHDEYLKNFVEIAMRMNAHTKHSIEHFMHGNNMRHKILPDHVIMIILWMFVSRRPSDRYRCRMIILK